MRGTVAKRLRRQLLGKNGTPAKGEQKYGIPKQGPRVIYNLDIGAYRAAKKQYNRKNS